MASNDIPPQCRGTIRFGKNPQPWHYQRSDKSGQLFIIPGEDLRDWTKIASGALDYQHIAFQEHQATPHGQKFPGHDGAKAHAACAVCAADEKRTPQVEYIVPETVPPEVQAANDQHAAQLAAEAEQARKDAELKASLPPSREVLADQAALNRVRELEAEIAAMKAGQPVQAQDPHNATAAPLATDTQSTVTLTEQSDVTLNPDSLAGTHVNPTVDMPTQPEFPPETHAGHPTETALTQIAAADDIRPTHGTDPWTGESVPIYWNIPGAGPDTPYGAKKNGEPRRKVGNKSNAQRAEEAAS